MHVAKYRKNYGEKEKVIELSWSKLTQLSCKSDSNRVVSVGNCVLLRVRLNFPWPALGNWGLQKIAYLLEYFAFQWLLSMTGWINITVLLWQYNTSGFFLCINLITGLGSSELKPNYYTSESWLL